MPNYIKNRITIIGDASQVKEVFERFNTHHPAEIYKAHDGSVICKNGGNVGWLNLSNGEFSQRGKDSVLGLPEGWEIELTKPIDQFPDFNKVTPQPENIFNGDLGAPEEEMCRREGRPTWYDWNRANWGTKWNCSNCESESSNTFTFQTAWSGVPDLMLKMSELVPDIKIEYEYADEDTGRNCASYVFLNGKVEQSFEPQGGSKEAYELAFKLRPHLKEEYILDGDNYTSKDND